MDLQFIENISRWLNETQIKIKTEVAASNTFSKNLFEMTKDFEVKIDACKNPHLDKIVIQILDIHHLNILIIFFRFTKSVTVDEVLQTFSSINKLIYERAGYLKCFKEESMLDFQNDENVIKDTKQSVNTQGNGFFKKITKCFFKLFLKFFIK